MLYVKILIELSCDIDMWFKNWYNIEKNPVCLNSSRKFSTNSYNR